MKNLIKKILREQVSEKEVDTGFEDFYNLFKEKYGKTQNFEGIFQEIEKDIKKSPTPKITLTDRGMFCGMSLTNNVILSKSIFSSDLYRFIFVLFHEIAHQYQYKKYGKNLLYELTTNELTEATLDKLIDIEQVADRFGKNMANKYGSMFNLSKQAIYSPYDNIQQGKNSYRNLILKIQEQIKKGEITCVEQMESFMIDHLTSSYIPSYTYTGGTYGTYYPSYSKTYSTYDDDDQFYARNYDKYEKGEVGEMGDEIKETYEDELHNLKYEIQNEISEILGEVMDMYGETGLNIFIDMLNEAGFKRFFYDEKVETQEEVEDIDELTFKVDEDFYSVIEDLKEYIEKKLQAMMDDVEKMYGWEGSHMLSEMIDEEGFDDLWIEY